MWRIEQHRRADKQLSGSIPQEILKRYEKWKDNNDALRSTGVAGDQGISR